MSFSITRFHSTAIDNKMTLNDGRSAAGQQKEEEQWLLLYRPARRWWCDNSKRWGHPTTQSREQPIRKNSWSFVLFLPAAAAAAPFVIAVGTHLVVSWCTTRLFYGRRNELRVRDATIPLQTETPFVLSFSIDGGRFTTANVLRRPQSLPGPSPVPFVQK